MRPRRHLIASVLRAAALSALFTGGLLAQPGPLTATDGAVIPTGTFRVRLLTQWTRYDGMFGVPGTAANVDVPIGYGLNVDSLGVSRIPRLGTAQSQIRSASGLPQFVLDLGKLTTAADTRIVSSPLVVEYGVTRRLMLGVLVPLVQTRTTVVSQLNNRRDSLTNVGPNPALLSGSARLTNANVVGDLRTAAVALQTLLTSCAANPNQSQCQSVNGHQSQAQALVQNSTTLAGTLESLYGTVSVSGQPFVPLAGTPAQMAIDTTVASMGAQYAAYLGSSQVSGSVMGANGPAAMLQLQNFLTDSTIGRDTLGTTTRIGFGDIEIRGAFQLFDNFGDTMPQADNGLRARATLTGGLRLGTGAAGSHNRFFDTGTGYGQPGLELGGLADLLLRSKFAVTVGATYTAQLGSVAVQRPANAADAPFPLTAPVASSYSAGNTLDLLFIPRFRVTRVFVLEGTYIMRRTDADRYTIADSALAALPADAQTAGYALATYPFGRSASTEQDVGFGFSYSTAVSGEANAGRLMAEFSFRHLEAVKGSGGPIPKSSRDQLELRIYP